MNPFKTAKFKKLQKKWYEKLKRDGFRDIENLCEALIDHQNVYDFSQRIGFRSLLFESIRDYYYWASDMIILGKFKTLRDRKIWVLHAMGRSSREIAEVVPWRQNYIAIKIKRIKKYLQEQCKEEEMKRAA